MSEVTRGDTGNVRGGGPSTQLFRCGQYWEALETEELEPKNEAEIATRSI